MQREEAGWRLRHETRAEMPRLAWVAEVEPAKAQVRVLHGTQVECGPQWCVEGVWAGEFKRGDFHEVENFFGSGVRVDHGRLHFCSSVAPTDRLVHVNWRGKLYLSNSLVQLLAYTGARLRIDHDYIEETFASRSGIHAYPTEIPVLHPNFSMVHQDYHCNLIAAGAALERRTRSSARRFSSFGEYERSLVDVLSALRENQSSPARAYPVDGFTTVSGGYDSAAVSVLAKRVGIEEAFTTREDPSLPERHRESGLAVAQALGLKVYVLNNGSGISGLERHFLAGCLDGSEIVYHDLARHVESSCACAMLLTGYYGGVIWDRVPPPYVDDIRRRDVSGLGLTEVRLAAGFVHVPVPIIHARSIADVVAISNSAEMQRWSVGGDYDRPIPRRILEEAGVPRTTFGMVKRAQLLYYNEPRNAALREEFFDYVTAELGVTRANLALEDMLREMDHRVARLRRSRPWFADRMRNRRSLMFVWAVNSLATQFRPAYREETVFH